ncbi:MAG TPA: aminomethyl-transferring glycine dehydrogenase subunit GcvPA [Alphaproteobacteria bacterium]|nr:aminomethyl-transferring glycine dehydrogenase subunit GcvPA [Alphaproteobacteria bacterium]HNS44592.1 aminomethyl-transferring glycine dehydrogenase subunit GcvPA [Alphaproteobacteria bacterium]
MRYLPLTKNDRTEMLAKIGVTSVADFYKGLPVTDHFDLPDHQGELEVERFMVNLANRNRAASDGPFFLGAGVYHHHIPSTVDYIIQRSEFLTSYTPYQPEMAQGTLQVIFEFQTMIANLTGQDVANASMYDGATSCAEAALMAMRLTGREKVTLGTELNPQYRDVLESYIGKDNIVDTADETVAAIIVQSPDFFGTPHSYASWKAKADAVGAKLVVVITEIVSLGLLPAPTEADIVCGEAQSIGIPMSFGGPHLGFFACKQDYLRQMPGRLCGETVDADGRRGFVLTLSTREQHIRREKATSNICTNQGLCALAFTVHMALLGEDGLKTLARLNHERACALADELSNIKGVRVMNENFFNEFVVEFESSAKEVVMKLAAQNIIPGLRLDDHRLLMAVTEMVSEEDIKTFVRVLGE